VNGHPSQRELASIVIFRWDLMEVLLRTSLDRRRVIRRVGRELFQQGALTTRPTQKSTSFVVLQFVDSSSNKTVETRTGPNGRHKPIQSRGQDTIGRYATSLC
jgi:hypothetical protein